MATANHPNHGTAFKHREITFYPLLSDFRKSIALGMFTDFVLSSFRNGIKLSEQSAKHPIKITGIVHTTLTKRKGRETKPLSGLYKNGHNLQTSIMRRSGFEPSNL